jgi:hypothetical protein
VVGTGDATVSDAGGDGPAQSACPASTAAVCARKCDPTLGCVECLGDSDCTGADKFCILGSCVACRTNTDCGAPA